MSSRKFYLTAWEGNVFKQFDLTDIFQESFLTDLDGLGSECEYGGVDFGSSFKITSKKNKLQTIKGRLLFANDSTNKTAYQKFQDFLKFCELDNLRFCQFLPNHPEKEFSANCVLTKCGKSEVSTVNGTLNCDIEISLTTPYQVDLIRDLREINSNYVEGIIKNNGNTPMPISILIQATGITRVAYSLVDNGNNDIVYGKGEFSFSDGAVNFFEIENELESQKCAFLANMDLSKTIPNIDFPFIYAPPGKQCKLKIAITRNSSDIVNYAFTNTSSEIGGVYNAV